LGVPGPTEFLLTLPFPVGGIDGLSRNLQNIEHSRFTAQEITKLDLHAFRKPIVKDLPESEGVPARKLRKLIETDQILLDVLFLAHLESDNLVLGLLSGIVGAEVELKLGNEGIVVVEPGGDILGVWIDNGRFKPSKSITSKVGDHVIDLLVIPDECRRAILEIEDALEEESPEFVGVLAVEGVGIPNSGLRLIRGRSALIL
jgi:hypothetical protein